MLPVWPRLHCGILLIATLGCEKADGVPSTAQSGGRGEEATAASELEPSRQSTAQEEAVAAPHENRYAVETREDPSGTSVGVHPRGAEKPSWHLQLDKTGDGTLQLRWDSERPTSEQEEILSGMLLRLHRQHPSALKESALQVVLSPDSYPEYAERLARYAADDPEWRRAAAGLHEYIVEATRARPLHPELDRIVASIDYQVRLENVEKCMDARPHPQNELGRWLLERGIESPRRLPVGCLTARYALEARQSPGD